MDLVLPRSQEALSRMERRSAIEAYISQCFIQGLDTLVSEYASESFQNVVISRKELPFSTKYLVERTTYTLHSVDHDQHAHVDEHLVLEVDEFLDWDSLGREFYMAQLELREGNRTFYHIDYDGNFLYQDMKSLQSWKTWLRKVQQTTPEIDCFTGNIRYMDNTFFVGWLKDDLRIFSMEGDLLAAVPVPPQATKTVGLAYSSRHKTIVWCKEDAILLQALDGSILSTINFHEGKLSRQHFRYVDSTEMLICLRLFKQFHTKDDLFELYQLFPKAEKLLTFQLPPAMDGNYIEKCAFAGNSLVLHDTTEFCVMDLTNKETVVFRVLCAQVAHESIYTVQFIGGKFYLEKLT